MSASPALTLTKFRGTALAPGPQGHLQALSTSAGVMKCVLGYSVNTEATRFPLLTSAPK